MPRCPRGYLNTSFFHVMTQGINKSYIFENPKDILYYTNKMSKLAKDQNIEIVAYCIMSNHAHLLIQTSQINELSKYMQRLNTSYAKYYNKKYNKVGFVFRNRYEAEGIYGEKQLYNCVKYIANNPVKAGICENPEQYKFSRYPKINQEDDDTYYFIDTNKDDYTLCKEVIEKFLLDNDATLDTLKKNKEELKILILLLKERYNISFRKISAEIGISKDTIWRIYNS